MGQGDNKNDLDTVTAYFSALNPIAQKIHQDIAHTRTTYEHVWHALNHHEQGDLINDCLIKPEITLRYFDSVSSSLSATSTTFSAISNEDRDGLEPPPDGGATVASSTNRIYAYDGRNLRTFQTQRTGQKMVHDDTIGMFRDEHSGPFSFKTKSQLNLSLFPQPAGTTHNLQGGESTPAESSQLETTMLKLKPETVVNYTTPVQKYQKNVGTENCAKDGEPTRIIGGTTTSTSDDSKTDFLRSFICKDHLGLNATIDTVDGADDSHVDVGHERRGLIDSIDPGIIMQPDSSSTSLQSDDDYEKAAYGEESTLLLNSSAPYEMRKGFEFLSNW